MIKYLGTNYSDVCAPEGVVAVWFLPSWLCTGVLVTYVLRSAIISACVGVRPGATTSCLLFRLDNLVRTIQLRFAEDGFLGILHVMLLMDDTVILATRHVHR